MHVQHVGKYPPTVQIMATKKKGKESWHWQVGLLAAHDEELVEKDEAAGEFHQKPSQPVVNSKGHAPVAKSSVRCGLRQFRRRRDDDHESCQGTDLVEEGTAGKGVDGNHCGGGGGGGGWVESWGSARHCLQKVFSHNEWFLQSVDWVDGQATKYAMQLWLEGGSDGVNFTT